MHEANQKVIQFLEKEIKTYRALALFLAKEGIKDRSRLGDTEIPLSSCFYDERMKEAKNLVNDLRNPN